MNMQLPAFGNLKPSQLVEEYQRKEAELGDALAAFEEAGLALKSACSVAGEWGNVSIDTGRVHERELRKGLRVSAWRHFYKIAHIAMLATASEKRAFDQSMADPPDFTLDNIRATFGKYIADPRGSILKGLAEAFSDLDPAYKSHERMKIGVKGLPKRIILSSVGDYHSWGKDRLENVLNALATYQGKPMLTWFELDALLKEEDALLHDREIENPRPGGDDTIKIVGRGVRLRRFSNGNGHLYFEPCALADINRALAEFYGDVLPDCPEERQEKRRPGTELAKDLQYYRSPDEVADKVVVKLDLKNGERVLEPSCGCGSILDALGRAGARCVGMEVDPGRAEEAMRKGYAVHVANFLETAATGDFDAVAMNPPFYGKHYIRHVEHALRFLKSGGRLAAVLPVTARYDHGIINQAWAHKHGAILSDYSGWSDLPIGSFSESGTNINTTILFLRKI